MSTILIVTQRVNGLSPDEHRVHVDTFRKNNRGIRYILLSAAVTESVHVILATNYLERCEHAE